MKKTLLALAVTALFASQVFAEPQTYKENEIEEIVMKIHHDVDQGGYESMHTHKYNSMKPILQARLILNFKVNLHAIGKTM